MTHALTRSEAQAEAVRRWGASAQAKPNRNGLLDLGMPLSEGMFQLYGWGHTWEEAFTLAEERKAIYDNPSEHTAQASETFTQMRLFP